MIGKTRKCCGMKGGKRKRGVSTRRGRVHRKRTIRKDHRRRVHRKRTLRKGHKQRGGYLSGMIGQWERPAQWSLDMRSAFSHGAMTVSSLDKAMLQVINSKVYFKAAVTGSADRQATDDDAAVMQLLEEADTEITQTRQAVADSTRKMGVELKRAFPEDAAFYQKTMDENLGRPSRSDTTTPKGTWTKELKTAYDSVIAAASRLKHSSIPALEQVKVDGRAVLNESWDPEHTQKVLDMKIEKVSDAGLRDLKDAHERLSKVAKKMATELKKHDIKDFAKTHDYNLRHYLK